VLSSLISWSSIGWLNLPLLGTALPLSAIFLKLRSLQNSPLFELRRLDWTDVSLFTVEIILLALPLSWASNLYAWSSFCTLLSLLLGEAILLAFVFYEGRAITPIMPHRIFKLKTACATLIGIFILGISLYSLLLWLLLSYQAIMAKGSITVGSLSSANKCCERGSGCWWSHYSWLDQNRISLEYSHRLGVHSWSNWHLCLGGC
jgi:hypothetical protein